MRYYTRRKPKRARGENYSFWLSFSDLMSALVLVFVLVLFYSVYQYFDMLEVSTAEIFRKTQALEAQESALNQKDAELNEKNAALLESQDKLTQAERDMIRQQAELLASQDELEKNKALLAQQSQELESVRAQLSLQQEQLGQQQALMADQQTKLDALVGVRARIIASLGTALQQNNIRATVDAATGAITLDSSVLFDTGQWELKESGKAVLDEFLYVYLNVLMNSENSQNISEIIIEGHTDTVGSYMSNLELSQRRALAVMQYILADDYGKISPEMKEKLREIATANGRSYSNPVYNADGTVNLEASRRVEFKFRLQDEQMIESMRQLLESME